MSVERPDAALLERHHDGELADGERRAVEAALAAHPEARADLARLVLVGQMVREGAEAAARDFDADRVFAAFEARISQPAPGSWAERARAWLTPPRLAPAGALAVLAAVGVAWVVLAPPAPAPAPGTAAAPAAAPSSAVGRPDAPPTPPAAAHAAPAAPAAVADNTCIVDAIEAEGGDVMVGATADEGAATVIWILADAGADAPGGADGNDWPDRNDGTDTLRGDGPKP